MIDYSTKKMAYSKRIALLRRKFDLDASRPFPVGSLVVTLDHGDLQSVYYETVVEVMRQFAEEYETHFVGTVLSSKKVRDTLESRFWSHRDRGHYYAGAVHVFQASQFQLVPDKANAIDQTE